VDRISETAQDVWGADNADLIESAFETAYKETFTDEYVATKWDRAWLKAKRFGAKYKTPKLRMAAIMRNVIRNKGTFKP
jgi:hypothetical protein